MYPIKKSTKLEFIKEAEYLAELLENYRVGLFDSARDGLAS
jgi:hypothetical protein